MRRRLRAIAAAVTALLLLPLAVVIVYEARAVAAGGHAKHSFDVYADALIAAEKISAERGPANGAMGADLPLPAERADALAKARKTSDERLEALSDAITANGGDRRLRSRVKAAKDALTSARARIDGLLKVPLSGRSSDDLTGAVNGMVAVVPHFLQIANAVLNATVSQTPGATAAVRSSVVTANLREQAGLLGSRFTAALAGRRALTLEEQYTIERSLGRIEQLKWLLDAQSDIPEISASRARAKVDTSYFAAGIEYVDSIRLRATNGDAGLTTAEFAAAYVPTMSSIIDLRDELLDIAKTQIADHRSATITKLALAILAAAFVICAVAGVTRIYERAALVDNLRLIAGTDSLTGLLNRRAFEERAASLIQNTTAPYIALVVFDVDRFKSINDTHGHHVGDQALMQIADLARSNWRGGDLIARLGGEEFAVIMEVQTPIAAIASAERFRARLADARIPLDDGGDVGVTASVGVTYAPSSDAGELTEALKRADKLLYRAKENGRNRVEHARA